MKKYKNRGIEKRKKEYINRNEVIDDIRKLEKKQSKLTMSLSDINKRREINRKLSELRILWSKM